MRNRQKEGAVPMDLQQLIDSHHRIVFFGGQVFPPKAAFRISAAWTVCTIRNTLIRPKPY